jgi:LPS-assembly protein
VLPYATVPISKSERNSGFLIPGFSKSNVKGISLSIPYYQTLGRSADITPRLNIYTARGIGYGADVRTRSREDSYLNTGFFIVQDRLFGDKGGADQGGTAFYARAVQFFPKGFVGTADVNITSSFAFRQVFSDSFQQAISPEEKTQIYLTNNFSSYSFNALFLSRSIFLSGVSPSPDQLAQPSPPPQTPGAGALITFRRLPSFSMSGRPQRLVERVPVYLSFDAAIEGVTRKEPTFKTPSVVQRLDGNPRFTLPLFSFKGVSVTPDIGLRTTFYSETVDPRDRTRILGESLTRHYVDFSVDIRPPSFERSFYHRDGTRRFKHVVEPSLVYRRIRGIGSDFARVIRVDENDAVANTNEVEYSLVNRFFTTRQNQQGQAFPHELLSVRISQKYFFDPTFGGALVAGQRNQFFPINTLSGYSFGGEPRRFSPVSVSTRVQPLSSLLADVRFDYDTREKTLRAFSVTVGMRKASLSVLQTWYYTHRVGLGAGRFEAGTFSGNLWQSSFSIGNQGRGPFVGADLLYDFTDRIIGGTLSSRRLASSTIRAGYGFGCCSLLIQNTTFKVGLRSENRLAFALVLNGIGSFGSTSAGRRFFEPYAPQ